MFRWGDMPMWCPVTGRWRYAYETHPGNVVYMTYEQMVEYSGRLPIPVHTCATNNESPSSTSTSSEEVMAEGGGSHAEATENAAASNAAASGNAAGGETAETGQTTVEGATPPTEETGTATPAS